VNSATCSAIRTSDFARRLRNEPTVAEKLLWHFLRGAKFRRQAAIGPYIVDFVCFTRQLVVELLLRQ